MLEVGRLAFGILRISAAVIMITVAPALRSSQDKLNLNSKVLKLFFLPQFNHKKAGGWAGGRSGESPGGVDGGVMAEKDREEISGGTK